MITRTTTIPRIIIQYYGGDNTSNEKPYYKQWESIDQYAGLEGPVEVSREEQTQRAYENVLGHLDDHRGLEHVVSTHLCGRHHLASGVDRSPYTHTHRYNE